ncbi:hypothetical protein FACS189430_12310 [Bacteroidia bacterium]|nr:hypothetical protein FACS189430_12310 [Bacteroidia bacterium]
MEQTTIKEKTKTFDTVKTFRKIKENISAEIWGLSYEELMAYFEKSKLEIEIRNPKDLMIYGND